MCTFTIICFVKECFTDSLHNFDKNKEVLPHWRYFQSRANEQRKCQINLAPERCCFCCCYAGLLWCCWTFPLPWEGKSCSNSRTRSTLHQDEKKKKFTLGPLLYLVCTAVSWFISSSDTKFYVSNLRNEGELFIPWIQNQILWDLLEFNNKHLQTLLIQYSIWHIWIKPTSPSCFPTKWLGK